MKRLPDHFRASIAAYLAETTLQPIPKGWITSKELQVHLEISQRMTGIMINRFVATNDVEVRKFRARAGQTIRPVPHYRFTPRAAKVLGLDKRT